MHANDRRKDLLCCVAMCLLAIANWAGRLAGPIDLRWDGGVYYTLGTSLYEGKGYRLLNEPGEIRAIQYPPLLPAIVAVHQAVTGSTDPFVTGRLMRRSWMILYSLYIPAVFWLSKRYVGRALALAIALITLLNPQSTFLSELCFAELPFALMSLVFFMAHRENGRVASGIAFTAATACYLLRAIGITILGAWVLDAVLQRRFRSAAVRAAFALVPVLAWSAYIYSVETSPDYRHPVYAYQRADYMFYNVSYAENVRLQDPFRPADGHISTAGMVGRLVQNLPRMIVTLAEAITSSNGYWHWQLDRTAAWLPRLGPTLVIRGAQVCLAILILIGLVRLFRMEPAMAIYVALSLLAIASAPWPRQYVRYLSPVAPYLAMTLVLGLAVVGRLVPQKMAVRLTGVVICLVVLQQAISLYLCYRHEYAKVTEVTRSGQAVRFRRFYFTEADQAMNAAHNWIRERTRPTDVIAASMPHWLYLKTGRKAVMVPFGANLSVVGDLLAGVPVNYVVLDEIDGVSVASMVAPAIENSSAWLPVFTPNHHCRVLAHAPSRTGAVWSR